MGKQQALNGWGEDAIGARGRGSCVTRELVMPDRQFR